MRSIILLFTLLLLGISACEKEEILPKPPAAAVDSEPASEKEGPKPATKLPVVESESYQYGNSGNIPYRILTPRNFDATKSYPLVVFLHGIGERGTDNEQQLTMGANLFQTDSIRAKYPSFVVYPQCPPNAYWMDDNVATGIKALVDTLISGYNIDRAKISIAGFSMGAYGTFGMVARNPDLFRSAVAISGDGDVAQAPLMSKTKWRIFAGKQDKIVPSSQTENMSKALKKAGASVAYTLYPEADHVHTPWIAFSEPDFLSWIFEQ